MTVPFIIASKDVSFTARANISASPKSSRTSRYDRCIRVFPGRIWSVKLCGIWNQILFSFLDTSHKYANASLLLVISKTVRYSTTLQIFHINVVTLLNSHQFSAIMWACDPCIQHFGPEVNLPANLTQILHNLSIINGYLHLRCITMYVSDTIVKSWKG